MAYLTADVVPSDDEEQPFKVVFLRGTEIIAEWLVETQEEGEEQLLEAVKELGASEDDEGAEEDDEDQEGEEDQDKDEEDNQPTKRGRR